MTCKHCSGDCRQGRDCPIQRFTGVISNDGLHIIDTEALPQSGVGAFCFYLLAWALITVVLVCLGVILPDLIQLFKEVL